MRENIHEEKSTLPPAILFVDDEVPVRKAFKRVFSDFRVLTAGSAGDAIRLLEEKEDEIGILITDHFMPDKEGTALLLEVQDRWPDIVRLLTTIDPTAASTTAKGGAVFSYIVKPWDLKALKEHISDAMTEYESKKDGSAWAMLEPDFYEIGQRIKRLREKRQLSESQLAEKLNVSSKTIQRWEIEAPRDVSKLIAIAYCLDISWPRLIDNNLSLLSRSQERHLMLLLNSKD